MQTIYKIILTFFILVFAGIGLAIQNGGITGLEIATIEDSQPSIIVTNAQILDTRASINWATDKEATSTFLIEGEKVPYGESTSFGINLDTLAQGKHYSYEISACDRKNNCNTYKGEFTTLSNAPAQPAKQQNAPSQATGKITGNAVKELSRAQTSINSAIFILLAIAASFVVISAAVQRMDSNALVPPSIRIGILVNKAEAAIRNNRHYEAYPIYDKIRGLYENLNSREKGKHQGRVMNVYSELLAHTRAKEANYLVDKYLEGSITKQELYRMRELLES